MKARYWDSNLFLGWHNEESDKVKSCGAIIHEAQGGKIAIVTSALTIAEVVWIRGEPRLPKQTAERIRAFFAHKYIAVRDLDRRIAEFAQRVVWDYGITPKDAIHIATALDVLTELKAEFDQYDTYDEDLIKKSGVIGGEPPMKIAKPHVQETLFDLD